MSIEQHEEEWKDEDFLSFDENGDGGDGGDGDDDDDDQSEGGPKVLSTQDLPPWMDEYTDFRRVSPLVALHNEVCGFCNLMSPMPREMKERDDLVERFKTLAQKTFGSDKCDVIVFGSQATGLCLPSSDIDIVIHLKDDGQREDKEHALEAIADDSEGKGQEEEREWNALREKSPLETLGEALREEWRGNISYLEVILKTKVPLVKFTYGPTNTSVDVSFLKAAGPEAATLIKTYMDAMPPLRPLIFVLKYFLAARVLNEPYSGGVGSFMLQLMIVSFLQHRERDAFNFGKPGLYNLGCLLLEFFQLYGTQFNYCTTGISVRHDGCYFRKGERKEDFVIPSRPFSLAIENPLDINADVGKASFRMSIVQRAFAAAYKVLLAHTSSPVEPVTSILATVIPPTDEMMERKKSKDASFHGNHNIKEGNRPPSTKPSSRKKRRFR